VTRASRDQRLRRAPRRAQARPGETPRLRPGPKGLPRNQVAEIQRTRILTAAIDTVQEAGHTQISVAQIIARARVSRKTFYDVFADREDCILAAFDHILGHARLLAREAYSSQVGWQESLRAALARLLLFIKEEPGYARLCIVGTLSAGERILQRRVEILDELARLIDEGRRHAKARSEPTQVTAEGVVGGILAVLHARLLDDDGASVTELLGPLMSMIVLPYLGSGAARRELARPPLEILRRESSSPPPSAGDPLAGLNIRLTYRTVRVLGVVAARPGASNREVADGAGVIDQGQISKLLARLDGLELVENRGAGQESGAANAWHLTAKGAQVERATRL
jgi:AcrR family transcriptional regulator